MIEEAAADHLWQLEGFRKGLIGVTLFKQVQVYSTIIGKRHSFNFVQSRTVSVLIMFLCQELICRSLDLSRLNFR